MEPGGIKKLSSNYSNRMENVFKFHFQIHCEGTNTKIEQKIDLIRTNTSLVFYYSEGKVQVKYR